MDIGAIVDKYKWIIDIIAYVVALASVVVKITPTLKDDNIVLPIVKFIGKWIALDKYSPPNRPN